MPPFLQATAIAFGANHCAALLINPTLDGNTGHHSLYTCGRGFYGQLGHGDYEAQTNPKQLCIGYQVSVVSIPGSLCKTQLDSISSTYDGDWPSVWHMPARHQVHLYMPTV